MKKSFLISVFLLIFALSAYADIITIKDPGSSVSEIGARIRWGKTGFEASIFDNMPFKQSPTMDPSGAPVWQLNNPYKFQVVFSSIKGTLRLSVDFNRDDSFGAEEFIARSTFNGLLTSYSGYGFNYISISGNESGSIGRSTINHLVINGTSLPSLSPESLFLEKFYKESLGNILMDIVITGELTFLTSGTAQERPSWNFVLRDASEPVSEPVSMLLFGTGLVGAGGYIRHKMKKK